MGVLEGWEVGTGLSWPEKGSVPCSFMEHITWCRSEQPHSSCGRRGWLGVVWWVKCDQKKHLSYQLFVASPVNKGTIVLSPGLGQPLLQRTAKAPQCGTLWAGETRPVLRPPRQLGSGPCAFTLTPGTAFSGCKDNAAHKDDATMDSAGGKN